VDRDWGAPGWSRARLRRGAADAGAAGARRGWGRADRGLVVGWLGAGTGWLLGEGSGWLGRRGGGSEVGEGDFGVG
jgi:hypothetical protein